VVTVVALYFHAMIITASATTNERAGVSIRIGKGKNNVNVGGIKGVVGIWYHACVVHDHRVNYHATLPN
jgi:hypothetical protein